MRRPWLVLAALPLATCAGFAAGVPGALVHPDVFRSGVRVLAAQYAGSHPPHGHFPATGKAVGDLFGRYFVALLGWPVLLAASFGIATLAWRRSWAFLLLLLGPVAVFGGYFATRTVFFERNVSHVLPLFLALAGIGVAEAGRLVAARRRALAAPLALVLLAALTVRPLAVTRTLVFDELSGRADRAHAAFAAELRARHPEAELRATTLLPASVLDDLAAYVSANPRPVLICVIDYNDEWTAARAAQLLERFDARLVADRPSSFSEFPVCTLHTYLRPRERYFLVNGLAR